MLFRSLPILPAGFERAPIEIIAVFRGNRLVVFLDAAFHFLKDRFDERLARGHGGLEMGVLSLQIIEHFGIGDVGVFRVAQPHIIVGQRDAVDGFGRWLAGGADELILDEPALAAGKEYFRLGALSISECGRWLAYAIDDNGSERLPHGFAI